MADNCSAVNGTCLLFSHYYRMLLNRLLHLVINEIF